MTDDADRRLQLRRWFPAPTECDQPDWLLVMLDAAGPIDDRTFLKFAAARGETG
jgi:hypothetical protein